MTTQEKLKTETLLELAERCEAATGPDRVMDEALGQVMGWQLMEMSNFDTGRMWHEWKGPKGAKLPLGTLAKPPFYTASIDAAMTLVPEGCAWIAGDYLGKANAVKWQGRHQYSRGWASLTDSVGDEMQNIRCNGTTPALALCAAALRARAA